MNRTPTAAPESLVSNGLFNFGVFDAPPKNVNLLDADAFGPILSSILPLKKLRLKKWQFYMVVNPEVSFGFLIIDLAFASSSFLYVYDRIEKKFFEHKRIKLNRDITLADDIYSGRCGFAEKGYSIEVKNILKEGRHEIVAQMTGSKKSPAVKAEITMLESNEWVHPLVVSLPVGDNRGMYSHKAAAPVKGFLQYGNKTVTFDPSRDICILDEHKAFYPHHTFWKWATFAFIGNDGRIVGANLTDNLIKDQERWNENAIWSGGDITLLGPVKYEFDLKNIKKPWKITGGDGRVDLIFTPEGAKIDQTNAVVFKMDYYQPYGVFNGTLTDGKGVTHQVNNVFGITEYHDAHY